MKTLFDGCLALLGLLLLMAVCIVLWSQHAPQTHDSNKPNKPNSSGKCCPGPCGTTPNAILIQEGYSLRVKSILTGQQHRTLQMAAEDHAAYQAKVGKQGHQNWENRVKILRAKLPYCSEFSEVANESWSGQDVTAAAKEMYRSWKLSPGHWSCVDGPCTYYGYAMVRGKNGTWYACGIFAVLR